MVVSVPESLSSRDMVNKFAFSSHSRCPARGRHAVRIRDRIAQRSAERAEDRGLDEKILDFGRNVGEHLADQVVHHVAVLCVRPGDLMIDLAAIAQRQRCQAQAGGPASVRSVSTARASSRRTASIAGP